jgi:methionyl-tRNA formyltransferase
MNKLKIVFAGTPEFAAEALRAIIEAGHEVVLVMTQPDRPAGRGLKLQPSAVKLVALENQLHLIQPASLRIDGKYSDEASQAKARLEQTEFDVMVVAAYGLILPQWTLDLAENNGRRGCLNIHASLLPRWRGAAPIHRAIWSGDQETGTCIMKMNAGLDTGPVFLKETLPIKAWDNTASLHDRLAKQGAVLVNQVLADFAEGKTLPLTEQPIEGVTYAEKIRKDEAAIDWSRDAVWIDRQIRALNPSPGATTKFGGELVKVWNCELVDNSSNSQNHRVGEIVSLDDRGIVVATSMGRIRLLELQKAGSKKGSALQFAQQVHLNVGMHFGE